MFFSAKNFDANSFYLIKRQTGDMQVSGKQKTAVRRSRFIFEMRKT